MTQGQANPVPPADIPNVPQPAPGPTILAPGVFPPPPLPPPQPAVPAAKRATAGRADLAAGRDRARDRRALRPRRAADHLGAALARLRRQARPERRVPRDQGRPLGAADLRAAARRLRRARQLRPGAAPSRRCSCAATRARCSRFRPAGCRSRARSATCGSRPARSRSTSTRAASSIRATGGRIVVEHVDRRPRAAAGGHLLHPVEIRRRQLGGALRHPRAVRQADRRDGDASRRGDHVQAGEPQGRRGARQHRLGGGFAGRRHHHRVEGRVSARDPRRRRIQA